MEVSQLIELMNAVSEAGLTDFCYEENGVSVKIKKHPEAGTLGTDCRMFFFIQQEIPMELPVK